MWRRFRPPLALVALSLFGLIVLIAVLQYRWLGQISDAERTERRATLAAGAREFSQDFDREITRAYLLFQADGPLSPSPSDDLAPERFAARYDRWQASARFPKLIEEFYVYEPDRKDGAALRRFDPSARTLEAATWPEAMSDWANELAPATWTDSSAKSNTAYFIRRMPSAVWEKAPAIVVPTPRIVIGPSRPDLSLGPQVSYTLLLIDRDYVARELLPSLAERYFGNRTEARGLDFKVAVVSRTDPTRFVFQSPASFAPSVDGPADATAELFQVRTQDFLSLAAEVRRFSAFVTTSHAQAGAEGAARFALTEGAGARPLSIVIQPGPLPSSDPARSDEGHTKTVTTEARVTSSSSPSWALLVSHPSGSLDAAIASQRRRNLAISSTVLGLLGASMGLLVLATRRAQRLAAQQMEFVAAVSHELRTPLAVIRSAADNLAEGVVHDEARVKRYGELMRTEGRRLTEMVEQILEFAGIQSGQRGFSLRPVGVAPLVSDILSSCADLIENAGLIVDVNVPQDLPPVLGDEPALRRVFQNLIDNAIKYGAAGGSIRVSARREGSEIAVTIADRGIGIDAAHHARIFEPFYRTPDVIAAQMQGAGLGLSLVHRIVTAHGGRVTVRSAPREGSEFTVLLPAADERAAVESSSALSSTADAAGVQPVRTS